jgi:quercetin dioxygenase-like cupin family protein
MNAHRLFAGFSVAAGTDRFDDNIKLGEAPHDGKLPGQETGGAIAIFEFSGLGGWPRHLHREQDESIYVIDGELELEIASKRSRALTGESIFIPRQIAHAWMCAGGAAKIINTDQPTGNIEDFFRVLGKNVHPPIHEVLSFEEMRTLFDSHGMDVGGAAAGWRAEDRQRPDRRAGIVSFGGQSSHAMNRNLIGFS